LNRCSSQEDGLSCLHACHALAAQAPNFLENLSSRHEVLVAMSALFQKFHLDMDLNEKMQEKSLRTELAHLVVGFYALCSELENNRGPLHDAAHGTQQLIDALAIEFSASDVYDRNYCCQCVITLGNLSLDTALLRDMIDCGVPFALIAVLLKFEDQEVRRRCIFALANLSAIDSESHHASIIKQGAMQVAKQMGRSLVPPKPVNAVDPSRNLADSIVFAMDAAGKSGHYWDAIEDVHAQERSKKKPIKTTCDPKISQGMKDKRRQARPIDLTYKSEFTGHLHTRFFVKLVSNLARYPNNRKKLTPSVSLISQISQRTDDFSTMSYCALAVSLLCEHNKSRRLFLEADIIR